MKPYVPTNSIPLATLSESSVVADNRCLPFSRVYSDRVVVGSCQSGFGRGPALMTSIRKHTAYSNSDVVIEEESQLRGTDTVFGLCDVGLRQYGEFLHNLLRSVSTLQIFYDSRDWDSCTGEHRLSAHDLSSAHYPARVIRLSLHCSTNARSNLLERENIVKDELVRGAITFPSTIGMLEEDFIAGYSESQLT